MNYFLSILSINTVQLRVAPLYGSWWQVNELLALEDERKNSSFPLLLFSAPLCSVLWLFTASFHCCLQHWLALCLFYLPKLSHSFSIFHFPFFVTLPWSISAILCHSSRLRRALVTCSVSQVRNLGSGSWYILFLYPYIRYVLLYFQWRGYKFPTLSIEPL